MHSSAEAVRAEAGRDFWRGVLAAGGFTAMPRWTREPIVGIAVHDAVLPSDLVAASHRLADELDVPLSSVLAGRARQGALCAIRASATS